MSFSKSERSQIGLKVDSSDSKTVICCDEKSSDCTNILAVEYSHDQHDHSHKDSHDHDHGHSHDHDHDHSHTCEASDLVRIGLVGVLAACGYFELWKNFVGFDVFSLSATVFGGIPIFKEAISALKSRRMTMELSMTIALVAAMAIGEFITSAFIVFFVPIAEVLEGLTVEKGHKAIDQLAAQLPNTVLVKADGEVTEKQIKSLKIGEIIIAKPGSMIAADGLVIHGTSFIDESSITGEISPVEKVIGEKVFAGTVNQSGYLELKVESTGRDTIYGKVLNILTMAEGSRAPVQKLADKLAGYLVYFAMASAALTFLITGDIRSTISVIIVAGACGIAAGTPLALLGAIGRAARTGAIVKGARYIEQLAEIDTVIFDKTGTLTLGKPVISKVQCFGDLSESEILRLAASAESLSEHPIAGAIVESAKTKAIKLTQPSDFKYYPGEGIECRLQEQSICIGNRRLLERMNCSLPEALLSDSKHTSVFLCIDKNLQAVIEISDTDRKDSKDTVDALRKMGLKTVLLTGDSRKSAASISESLGIDEYKGELLPHQKAEEVRALLASGSKVAMVGDGVNDAPAMLEASVGISVGSATALTRESADIVLIGDELGKFLSVLKLSKRCSSIIWFNFAGTILVDILGIVLAAFGMLTPLLAALVHVVSELAFILNSARLIPINKHKPSK